MELQRVYFDLSMIVIISHHIWSGECVYARLLWT